MALGCASCGQPPAIGPGEESQGELGPESEALYRLEVATGEYARLRLGSESADDSAGEIDLSVFTPDGEIVVASPGIQDPDGGLASWIAEQAGSFRVVVANPSTATTRSYRLVVEEVRPARAGDEHRVSAERASAEAVRLAGDDRPAALAASVRAFDHWQQVGDLRAAAGILLDMAYLEQTSDPRAALDHCRQVLEIASDGGLLEESFEALNYRGVILRRMEDCPGARAAYEEALKIAREIPDGDRARTVAYNLARLTVDCEPDQAIAALERLIEEAIEAGDPASAATALRQLAIQEKKAGDLDAALEHLGRARSLAQASGKQTVQADVAHEQGNLYGRLGQLPEALESYQQCRDLTESLGDQRRLAGVLHALGVLSVNLRQPEEAWSYLQAALKSAEGAGDTVRASQVLREQGIVLLLRQDHSGAEELFRQALTKARQADDRHQSWLEAQARVGLGSTLLEAGRAREAAQELSVALELEIQTGDRLGEALARRALGTALGRLGEIEVALGELTRALELSREQGDPLRTTWTLYRLAEVQSLRDPTLARRTIEEAIELGQRVRSGLSVDPLRTGFSEGSRRLYDLHLRLLIEAGDDAAAFAASERGRSRALLDLLAEARVDLAAGAPPALIAESHALDARISWLQTELRDAAAGESEPRRLAELRTELERAESDWWRVEAAIRASSPRYDQLRDPPMVEVSRLRAGLPAGRALLEYWVSEERSYLFVLTRQTFEVLPLPPATEIQRRVAALRASAVGLQPPKPYGTLANALYREVVAPGLAAAARSGVQVEGLIVVPDGPLHLVPFEALVTEEPAPGAGFGDLGYLVRDVSISYVPSASVLESLGRESTSDASPSEPTVAAAPLRVVAFADPRSGRPMALACPEMGGTPGSSRSAAPRTQALAALGGSRQEALALAAPLGRRARVYLGEDASEDRFKTDPEVARAERIHVAAHGVVCESFPERSGLVLTEGGATNQDGILQAREIFGLELSSDLVVLSACETGLGRLVSGEGIVGLSRAFFHAGVPSLVVSLWQVSDRSTAKMMSDYYGHLDSGLDKAEALRQAQLGLIDGGGSDAAPFYWAPFVLLGSREVSTVERASR